MDPQRLTSHPTAHEQLLYFTSSSLDHDDSHLLFISDRTGHPNVYARNLATGAETALSKNAAGTLKSYVYFNGREGQGLGKASISFDSVRRLVYFVQDDAICVADFQGQVRVLAQVPADQKKKNEVISDKPDYDIDERVQNENLSSYLNVYDTATGDLLARERVPKAWITHVQFSPVDRTKILYNHEWPAECGIRRLWLWDGQTHHRLRTEGEGRTKAEWTCHEMWQSEGRYVIYHGKYPSGIAYVGRVDTHTLKTVEISLPSEYHRYGHFTVGNRHDDWLACDGYYHPEGAAENENWGGEWISLVKVDWDRRIAHRPRSRHLAPTRLSRYHRGVFPSRYHQGSP